MRKGNWMQTFLGNKYYPLDPRAEEVSAIDIAHALSMLCRYNGHTTKFYSVAEHCCHLHDLVPAKYKKVALLHDATEAYTCDMPRPLKLSMPAYKEIETLNWLAICERFDMSPKEPGILKELDLRICLDEREAVMSHSKYEWNIGEPLGIDIPAWTQPEAKRQFLKRWLKLKRNER